MNTVILTIEGKAALSETLNDYGDPSGGRTKQIIQLCADMEQAGEAFSKATFYRIADSTPVRLQNVETLFSFLKISTDIIGDGYAAYDVTSEMVRIVPAKRGHIRWMAHAEGLFFGSNEVAQKRILDTFYSKNPQGFFVFFIDNQIVGSLTVVPIKEPCLQSFAKGIISESSIGPDDIYAPEEAKQVRSIYVESLILNVVDKKYRARIYRNILMQRDELLSGLCLPKNLQYVYALAASEVGERLLTTLGFAFIPPRKMSRKDGRKMFYKEYAEIHHQLLGEK